MAMRASLLGIPLWAARSKAILLVFSLCAIVDFVWSYVRERSIAEGVTSAALGLFGTAWYVFLTRASWKGRPPSDS